MTCTNSEITDLIQRSSFIQVSRNADVRYQNTFGKYPRQIPRRGSLTSFVATRQPSSSSSQLEEDQIDLLEYICSGPLLQNMKFTRKQIRSSIQLWEELGQELGAMLNFDMNNLSDLQRSRIYHYYLPIFFWVQRQLAAHRLAHFPAVPPALVVGISAPQGCGKTTLVENLQALLTKCGNKATSVSVDDFYLTYAEQNVLASKHDANQLLELRGNAGSHDLTLGREVLKELKQLRSPGQSIPVPRYNKSAYSGRGDRAESSTFPKVTGPLEVVLLEGWMLGFKAMDSAHVAAIDDQLVAVNDYLKNYEKAWDSLVDTWMVVKVGDPQWVFKWRLQAEEVMKASGKPGLSEQQVADFVQRFMPSYRAYLPAMYTDGPTTAKDGHLLVIEVDEQRRPVDSQPLPLM